MATLEERVAALEARTIADTAQPTFLTIDPVTGKIGATFSGNLQAAGVDLLASTVALPLPANEIIWHVGTFAGAKAMEAYVYRDANPNHNGFITVTGDAVRKIAGLNLQATGGSLDTRLVVTQDSAADSSSSGFLFILEGTQTGRSLYLLRGDGSSGFHAACTMTKAAVQSIPNNAFTTAVLDTAEYDEPALTMANVAGNDMVVKQPGVYIVTASVMWPANGAGRRILDLNINGAVPTGGDADMDAAQGSGVFVFHQTVTVHKKLAVNDTIGPISVLQNSGAALNVTARLSAALVRVTA